MTPAATCALCCLAILAASAAPVDTAWHEGDGEPWRGTTTSDSLGTAPILRCVERRIGPALGVCGELSGDNALTIDERAFSTLALAVGGDTRVSSPFVIGGDFVEAGALRCPGALDVRGDLSVQGAWTVSSPAHVTGGVYLASELDAINTVRVDGTLHVPPSMVLRSEVSAGAMVRQRVVVRSPLDCASAPRPRSLVDDAVARGSLLPADALEHLVEPSERTLVSGNYVLSRIAVDAPLTLHVRGTVLLAIEGDVRIRGPVRIELARGARLDLVIAGSLAVEHTLDVTGPDPGALWMAVGGDLRVASAMRLRGRLVMPEGSLAVDNTLEVWGAVLARDVQIRSPLILHDGASLSARGCAVD